MSSCFHLFISIEGAFLKRSVRTVRMGLIYARSRRADGLLAGRSIYGDRTNDELIANADAAALSADGSDYRSDSTWNRARRG